MTETLSRKDYLILSAYLDGELSQSDLQRVEKRLLTDQLFKRTSEELAYTKHMLRSMPKLRAPRNFMLTPERVKKSAKRQLFQPAWGLVSAVSTFLLLVIFAGTSLLPRLGVLRAAAPEMAPAANDAALAQKSGTEVTATPMIIMWDPPRAFGMGGGDGTGGAGGSGLPDSAAIMEAPESAPPESVSSPVSPTGTPDILTTEPLRQGDPSTLILGIPDEKSQGTYSNEASQSRTKFFEQISPMTFLMAGLGLIALFSAGLALLLRRR
jgi:hypothetical protein